MSSLKILAIILTGLWLSMCTHTGSPDPAKPEKKETTENTDLPLAGILSSSDQLIEQELSGKSYLNLTEDAAIIQQAYEIFSKIIK